MVSDGPVFVRLNNGWHADPNVPDPVVELSDSDIHLRFDLNSFGGDANVASQGRIIFKDCTAWRLGLTNDEGWYLGQCRYSQFAPAWGEFYEIRGKDPLRKAPTDWQILAGAADADQKHYLFYFRDETFEAFALDWVFSKLPSGN